MTKTNAIRILEAANIPHSVHEYDASDGKIDGVSVAAKCGRSPEMVFKTLVTTGKTTGLNVFVEGYRAAFDNFDVAKIATYDDAKVAELLQNPGIIRNRMKIAAAVTNAQCVLRLPGGLNKFIWDYVGGEPIAGNWARQEDMPVTTTLSDQISRDMKKLGFKFVGSTIIYSYLQAVGVVNDHVAWCDFRGI